MLSPEEVKDDRSYITKKIREDAHTIKISFARRFTLDNYKSEQGRVGNFATQYFNTLIKKA